MTEPAWTISRGDGPIIATAIHAGHSLRPDVSALTALTDEQRLREEDPFTDRWVGNGDASIAVDRSRFEVDLNRARDIAVYQEPDDAWGLDLWTSTPSTDMVAASLDIYDEFYRDLGALCDSAAATNRRFVVFDLHSYNHRRRGPEAPVDDPEANPEINVGTGTVDRDVWGGVVDVFSDAMREHPFDGGHLDVRENVRFKGGFMSRWINERYAGRGCALAIEMKKTYMDEWTGEPYESMIAGIGDALHSAFAAVRADLDS